MSSDISEISLLMSEKRQGSHSKNFSIFTPVLIRGGFEYIGNMNFILEEYKKVTGKEYEFPLYDYDMVEILRKNKMLGNNIQYNVFYVRNALIPYMIIEQHIAYDSIEINYDRYKLDLIKKVTSSEVDASDAVELIENILFQTAPKLIFTENEYIEMGGLNILQTEKWY